MINVRKGVPSDWEKIKDVIKDTHSGEHAHLIFDEHNNYAVFEDVKGNIGMVIGVRIPWEGVAEVYGVFTKQVDAYPYSYAKALYKFFGHALTENPEVHRIQAQVRETDIRARKLAEAFGMKQEGVMRGLNKKDMGNYIMYGRIF